MSEINNAAHPEWRELFQAALFEINPVKLLNELRRREMPFSIASKTAVQNLMATKPRCETHWLP